MVKACPILIRAMADTRRVHAAMWGEFMFAKLGAFVVRARWSMIAAAVAVFIIGATWGAGVFSHLASGGFLDPDSSSAKVRGQLEATFGPQDADLFVLYTAPAAVTDPAVQSAITS